MENRAAFLCWLLLLSVLNAGDLQALNVNLPVPSRPFVTKTGTDGSTKATIVIFYKVSSPSP